MRRGVNNRLSTHPPVVMTQETPIVLCNPQTKRKTDKAATTEIFPRLSIADLHELQTQDQIIGPVIAAWPAKPSLSKESPMRTLVKQCPRLFLRDGVLYRRQTDQRRGVLEQLALPSALRPDVIAAVHDKMGHQGYQ